MHYLDKQSAKVKICYALKAQGWTIFGYKEDESDCMTDYYSPARWDGIAIKNDYVLLVDVWNNSESGKEIKEKNQDASKVNHDKIQKLQAKADDVSAPEAEREACRGRIAVEMKKLENQYIVIGYYPVFTQGNPKGATWHIEKDGQIVAKGNGVYSVTEYDWEDETRTKEEQIKDKINKFVARIEKVLKDSDALKPEVITVSKKVIKPVQKQENTINKGDILSFSYHGHYWIVTDVYTVGEQERATYELLGSEKRGYNRLSGTGVKRYYQPMARLLKELEEEKTKVHTLQEVTVFEEKTVYKKTGRKQAKREEAIAIVGDVAEIEQEEEVANETVETQQNENNVAVTLNEEFNGVEIRFNDKPEQAIIEALKAHGYRWSKRGFWYAKQSADTLTFADTLKGSNESAEAYNSSTTELQEVSYPEIDINDLEQYTVSDELQRRVHDKSMFAVDFKKDCVNTFQNIQNTALDVLEHVKDNMCIVYYCKKYLQSYKKKYYELYLKILRHRSENPSWAVTGRGNLNARRYNKMQDRYGNMLKQSAEMSDEFKKRMSGFKNEYRRNKDAAMRKEINETLNNTELLNVFKVEKKPVTVAGYTDNVRTYNYQGYTIAKTWGCFRIFYNGEEIDVDLKTTDTLETAKKYVLMLVKKQEQSA